MPHNLVSISKVLLGILLFFFTFLMVRLTLPYLSFATDVDFLLTKQGILHLKYWYWSFYLHITSSIFVLFTGIFQFSYKLLHIYPKTHRLLGKIYVILILCVAAPSGFIMALYANGGFPAQVSFVLASILWFIFTLLAYLNIKKKQVTQHQAFVYRSYALTLSAISLRLYTLTFPTLFGVYGKDLYIAVAWLSWIPNILIVEIWLHYKKLV